MAKKAGMATGVEVARISVKVSPDTKQFRSELQRELNAIEQSLKGDIEVNAHLDPAQAMADFQRMMAKLKAQGAKGVNVKAKVTETGAGSAGGGGRSGVSQTKQTTEELSRVGKLVENIKSTLLQAPNFGSGINLNGYLVIATAIAGVLAPVAGLLTGLLLTLPGLLALVLTPIGAITLGLEGMKKAAEVLKKPFEDLRATMSAAVEDQFTPVFERLKGIFPTLQAALPAVSQGLASMLDGVVSAISSPEGLARIEKTIFQIGAALQGATPGAQSMTNAFTKLAETFTGGPLQGLVTWFNGALASFDKWVTKAQESGELELIFNRVGEALRMVMDGLGKIAAIGLDTLTDPQKWAAFKAILQLTINIIVWLFQVSADFLEWIGKTGQQMRVIWDGLVAVFNTVKDAITLFFTDFPTFVQAALVVLPAIWQTVWDWIKNLVQGSINTIVGIVRGLPGLLGDVWGGLLAAAEFAWNAFVTIVQAVWPKVADAVRNGIETVVNFVRELPGKMVSALGDLAGLLVNAGSSLMDGLLSGIKRGFEAVKNFVGGIAGWIAENKGPISYDKKVLVPNGESLMQGLQTGMTNGLQDVLSLAKEVAGKIKKAMDEGGDGLNILGDVKPEDLKMLIDAIEEERKRLKIMKNDQFTKEGKAGVQQQIDALQAQKDILSYQRDRVKNQEELNSTGEDDPFVKAASGLMKAPVDFATATGKQFMSDLGISGDGFISKGITEGIKYIFNIGSVDEAMSIKDRQDSKAALPVIGR